MQRSAQCLERLCIFQLHTAGAREMFVNRLAFPSPLTIPLPRDMESFQTPALSSRLGMRRCSPRGSLHKLATSASGDVGWRHRHLKPHSQAGHFPCPHSQLLHKPGNFLLFFFFLKVISISICLPLKLIRYIFKFHSNPISHFSDLTMHLGRSTHFSI